MKVITSGGLAVLNRKQHAPCRSPSQVEESPDLDGGVDGEWSGFLCQVWVDQLLRSLAVLGRRVEAWRCPGNKSPWYVGLPGKVMADIAMENGHRTSGFPMKNGDFLKLFWQNQRVTQSQHRAIGVTKAAAKRLSLEHSLADLLKVKSGSSKSLNRYWMTYWAKWFSWFYKYCMCN